MFSELSTISKHFFCAQKSNYYKQNPNINESLKYYFCRKGTCVVHYFVPSFCASEASRGCEWSQLLSLAPRDAYSVGLGGAEAAKEGGKWS